MWECMLSALVLGVSLVLLTGLQEVQDSETLLSWRWHALAAVPGASACLPFQLLHLTWALAGLLLCGCPFWANWYMRNRTAVGSALLFVGGLFEAGYFWQTEDALPLMVCRALVFPVAFGLCMPASLRLRSFIQGWGLVLSLLGISQRSALIEAAPVLVACLLVAHTSAACLSFFGQASVSAKKVSGLELTKGTEGKPTVEGIKRVSSHPHLNFKLEIEQEAGRGRNERQGERESQVTADSEPQHSESREAGTSSQERVSGFDSELQGEDLEEGETEEDDFEERILELASVPGAFQDRSETVFMGRPNASAALIESDAMAALLKKPSNLQGGASSSGEAPPRNERGSFVLTNEERMATQTSRLRALAGAASGKSPRGGVQQAPKFPPGRKVEAGQRVSAPPPAAPKLSISGALPSKAVAALASHSTSTALPGKVPSSRGGLSIGKRVSTPEETKATGINTSRKGKEKVLEEETLPEKKRDDLSASYAAVAAARAAEALGATRPWGMGAGSPSTELDYRTAGDSWRSPMWKGLGEEWLTWMQDMFFMGPGWDGGISRTDEEKEAAQKAKVQEEEENDDDSDDDESYDFAKMEEKYKGLLGSMRGFGGSADVSKAAGDVSRVAGDVSRDEESEESEEDDDWEEEDSAGAPNPWAIDLEQQKGWLKMIAEGKLPMPSLPDQTYPAFEAPAYTLDASSSAADLAKLTAVAAPHFVLDASSPVLRIEEPSGEGLSVAEPLAMAQVPFVSPPASSGGGVLPGGGLSFDRSEEDPHRLRLGEQPFFQKEEIVSDKIAQLLAAPAFTLNASIPAASPNDLSPEDVVQTSERITQMLAAPTFTLDASVPVQTPLVNSNLSPPDVFQSSLLDPEQLRPSSLGAEGGMTLRSGRLYGSQAQAADSQKPGQSFRKEAVSTQLGSGAGEGQTSEDAPPQSSFGGEVSSAVVGDVAIKEPTASASPHQAGASTVGFVFTPAFTLDASRPPKTASAPLFTLDASRPPKMESAPLFTLDASRPPEMESAPLFTLDASRPAAAGDPSGGNGKDASDGYAWTQMSERLARRSNGRGMSKVDQEWLKVMERVKDKIPQMQEDWKPELHIPFVALGN